MQLAENTFSIRDTRAVRGQAVLFVLLCALIATIIYRLTFIGFVASDDYSYLEAGRGWINSFPFVGTEDWSPRHTVVLPIALSLMLFGESEWSLTVTTLLYQIGIVALGGLFVWHAAGRRAGIVTAVLLLTMPLLALMSSIASDDPPEVFFVVLSLILFLLAAERRGQISLLLGAGACAALGMITRETTAALLLTYGILFLAGFGIPRRLYFVMAASFLAVEALDLLYFGLAAGDPLHRYHVIFDQVVSFNTMPAVQQAGYDNTGALRVAVWLDTLLMLFTRIDFGVLSYAMLPAGIWLFATRKQQSAALTAARVFMLLGVVWLVFNTALLSRVLILPRYYAVCGFSMAVVAGIWLGQAEWKAHRMRAAAILSTIIAFNLFAMYLANKEPLYGPRALVAYMQSADAPASVIVDPEFATRSVTLLEWAGFKDRVRVTTPQPGDIVFHDPFIFDGIWQISQAQARKGEFTPAPSWQPIWTRTEERRTMGIILERLGLASVLPATIYAKFDHPHPPVVAYRVPAG